jgi:hypothetical protein
MSLPPFDGTGWIAGMPGLPGGGASVDIIVAPGSVQTVASTDPNVIASPLTAWTVGQSATFSDGAFYWNGTGWVAGAAPALDEDTLSGWTKAELTQFAEDHEPPIPIPTGSTKPQIIALILAALADEESEEN